MAQKQLNTVECLRAGFRRVRIRFSPNLRVAGPPPNGPLTEPPIRKPEQNRQDCGAKVRPVKTSENDEERATKDCGAAATHESRRLD